MMRNLITAALALACALTGVGTAMAEPYLGLRLAQREGGKVEITYVDPAGLGGRIGLRKGDFVTRFNGQPVRKTDDLVKGLKQIQPGKTKEETVMTVGKDGPRKVKKLTDMGEYRFEVERRSGKATRTEVLAGTIKVLDEAEWKKIKARFPDSRVKPGTYYVSPKK